MKALIYNYFLEFIVIICLINCFACKENKTCLDYKGMVEKMKEYSESNYSYGLLNKLKFIHGPCNPVILIPGLLGSTLYLHIENCEDFIKENIDFRFHCRITNICNNGNTSYSSKIWPTMAGDFGFVQSDKNYSNFCFSYFMQFFTSNKYCNPATKNVNCRYSEHVRVYPFDYEVYKKRYVIDPVKSVINLRDSFVETESTFGFRNMYEGLKAIGYENNFSLSAIPYDFGESVCENEAFGRTLLEVSKHLYNNTKKKVVIISHSYGCLNTHYQLNTNKQLKDIVKHFISIAPPYLGSVNATEFIMSGNSEEFKFNNFLIRAGITLTSQYMLFPSMPVSYQLLPINPLEIFKDREKNFYDELKEAINNTMNQQLNKSIEFPLRKSNRGDKKTNLFTLFDKELKEFHSTDVLFNEINNICKSNEIVKEKIICDQINFFNMYNFISNPQASVDNNYFFNSDEENYLGLVSIKTLPKNFIHKINKNCNLSMADSSACVKKLTEYYSLEHFRSSFNFFYQKCRAFRNKMTNPGVDTTIIFNKTMNTTVKLKYDSNMHKAEYERSGGDKTVPVSSSLIPALKWMFEYKQGVTTNKIYLVDYCSSKYSKKHKYDNTKKEFIEDQYYFINCEASRNFEKSTHANMIGDTYLIGYIKFKLLNLIHNDETIDQSKAAKDLIDRYEMLKKKNLCLDIMNSIKIHDIFVCTYNSYPFHKCLIQVEYFNKKLRKRLFRKRKEENKN